MVTPQKQVEHGASEQRSAPTPPAVAPPPNRTPRFNRTIQESGGVRPGGTSGVRPQAALPPCTAEQEAAMKKKQAESKDQQKIPPDCVPASQQQPSQTRPPRH
jgi:hypothetical protein